MILSQIWDNERWKDGENFVREEMQMSLKIATAAQTKIHNNSVIPYSNDFSWWIGRNAAIRQFSYCKFSNGTWSLSSFINFYPFIGSFSPFLLAVFNFEVKIRYFLSIFQSIILRMGRLFRWCYIPFFKFAFLLFQINYNDFKLNFCRLFIFLVHHFNIYIFL